MTDKKERTLVIIKPDGVQRSLIGEVIKRYERSGLKLIGIKMLVPTKELTEKHYLLDPEWLKNVGNKAIDAAKKKGKEPRESDPEKMGEFVLETLTRYLTVGPVVAMVWQGMNAVEAVRKLSGFTEPLTADIGSIRGDYTIDSFVIGDSEKRAVRNIVHASGSVDEAMEEIPLWFKNDELINYRLVAEEILYDVNLDGILE